jgi:hypothetical protein
MAFLDNSGDIILDAVLTDTGRMRLAKGDGTFKIVKFALADDEIDYSLYQNSNFLVDGVPTAHPSGSAYYDLNILMTPVLEAFTNNMSGMKSKLLSIPRNNLLYLPVLKLATSGIAALKPLSYPSLGNGTFVVAVDSATEGAYNDVVGVHTGFTLGSDGAAHGVIRVDQGLDTEDIPRTALLDSDLKETQYIIEIDNRLGVIQSHPGGDVSGKELSVSYIDDDHIASYYVSLGVDDDVVKKIDPPTQNQITSGALGGWVLKGPSGTKVTFNIGASLDLSTSAHLFDKFGGTGTALQSEITVLAQDYAYKYIDTNIRVTGATTGASIDIPVRFVKND